MKEVWTIKVWKLKCYPRSTACACLWKQSCSVLEQKDGLEAHLSRWCCRAAVNHICENILHIYTYVYRGGAMRGAVLRTAKPGVPGFLQQIESDALAQVAHYHISSNWSKLFRSGVCVQTHLNEFLILHWLCYISFSGFPVAVSWVELTVHNITYLLCRLYSSGELVSANLLLLHFQRPVNCISSSIAGECQI